MKMNIIKRPLTFFSIFSFMFVASLVTAWTFTPSQVYAMAPFSCDGTSYIVHANTLSGTNTSHLYRISTSGGTTSFGNELNSPTGLTIGGTPITDSGAYPNGFRLNALGYNPIDKYFYASHFDNINEINEIYRIGSDGEMVLVASVTISAATNKSFQGATFAPDGTYYAKTSGDQLARVTGLDQAPSTPPSVLITTTSSVLPMGDLLYDNSTGNLFGMSNDDSNLYSISIATGVITMITQPGINSDIAATANFFGSTFMDATSEIYAYANDTNGVNGGFYHINKTTGRATLLGTGPVTQQSDGTSCVPVLNRVDIVKTAGAVTHTSATEFNVPFTIAVGNTGPVSLPNVQVNDNLAKTFALGLPSISVRNLTKTAGNCTLSSAFNGLTNTALLSGSDVLNSGDSCTITFEVILIYPSASSVPAALQYNTAYASSASSQNSGYTFVADGSTIPPQDVLAAEMSTNSQNLPLTANADTPSPTPVSLGTEQVTGKTLLEATGSRIGIVLSAIGLTLCLVSLTIFRLQHRIYRLNQ